MHQLQQETTALIALLEEKGLLSKDVHEAVKRVRQAQTSVAPDSVAPGPEPGVAVGNAPAPHKPRKVTRHKLQCRIFFAMGQTEGEGTVYNLSKAGCKVQCETIVESGMELEMSFFLPDHRWPLRVDRALVRWAKKDEFGVEFVEIQPSQRERLRLFLASLK